MAAGQGSAPSWDPSIRWKFDSRQFWRDYGSLRDDTLMNRIIRVLDMIPSQWRGRADMEGVPNGFKIMTGPNQSAMVSLTVTTDADGNYTFKVGPTTGPYMPQSLNGKTSPWNRSDIQAEIEEIFDDYVVEDEKATAKNRAKDLRGLAEASQGFEFGEKGKNPSPEAMSNIASFLTGKKATAGTPLEQMRQLRDEVDPNYAEKLEQLRTAETLAAMKGGRRKTRRSRKPKHTRRK